MTADLDRLPWLGIPMLGFIVSICVATAIQLLTLAAIGFSSLSLEALSIRFLAADLLVLLLAAALFALIASVLLAAPFVLMWAIARRYQISSITYYAIWWLFFLCVCSMGLGMLEPYASYEGYYEDGFGRFPLWRRGSGEIPFWRFGIEWAIVLLPSAIGGALSSWLILRRPFSTHR